MRPEPSRAGPRSSLVASWTKKTRLKPDKAVLEQCSSAASRGQERCCCLQASAARAETQTLLPPTSPLIKQSYSRHSKGGALWRLSETPYLAVTHEGGWRMVEAWCVLHPNVLVSPKAPVSTVQRRGWRGRSWRSTAHRPSPTGQGDEEEGNLASLPVPFHSAQPHGSGEPIRRPGTRAASGGDNSLGLRPADSPPFTASPITWEPYIFFYCPVIICWRFWCSSTEGKRGMGKASPQFNDLLSLRDKIVTTVSQRQLSPREAISLLQVCVAGKWSGIQVPIGSSKVRT